MIFVAKAKSAIETLPLEIKKPSYGCGPAIIPDAINNKKGICGELGCIGDALLAGTKRKLSPSPSSSSWLVI